jgi:hypothetical protein
MLFSIEILAIHVRLKLSLNLQYGYEVLIDYRKRDGISVTVISIVVFLEYSLKIRQYSSRTNTLLGLPKVK